MIRQLRSRGKHSCVQTSPGAAKKQKIEGDREAFFPIEATGLPSNGETFRGSGRELAVRRATGWNRYVRLPASEEPKLTFSSQWKVREKGEKSEKRR